MSPSVTGTMPLPMAILSSTGADRSPVFLSAHLSPVLYDHLKTNLSKQVTHCVVSCVGDQADASFIQKTAADDHHGMKKSIKHVGRCPAGNGKNGPFTCRHPMVAAVSILEAFSAHVSSVS